MPLTVQVLCAQAEAEKQDMNSLHEELEPAVLWAGEWILQLQWDPAVMDIISRIHFGFCLQILFGFFVPV